MATSSQSSILAPSTLNSLSVFPSRVTAKSVSLLPPSLCVQNTFVYRRLATTPELSVMAGFASVPSCVTPVGSCRSAPQPTHIDANNAPITDFNWPNDILMLVCLRIFDGSDSSSIQNRKHRFNGARHDLQQLRAPRA